MNVSTANLGMEVFVWGIFVIVVIAYSKYVSDWLEKGKNQFTYVNPYLKELTFWERIRRIFKNH